MKILLLVLVLMCPGDGSDGKSSECDSPGSEQESDMPNKVVGTASVEEPPLKKTALRKTKSNLERLKEESDPDLTEREGEGNVRSAMRDWSSVRLIAKRRSFEGHRRMQSTAGLPNERV